ncbi:MAG: DUF4912 domain-containing protein [Treponema sp.]|nr:DUF4912 domain-containing protein [Treponema sp.]MCL2251617.1 DUF4912 domain-containing protein [Treponema sp.]
MEENLHKQGLQPPVTRASLESLSTDELIKKADSYGIDIPLGLERIFIIEEILECANEDVPENTDDIEVNPSYSETALMPKQYNISFINVIIRDPLWAFVFWEIKGHDRETYENAPDFNGYCLRVIPLNEGDTSNGKIQQEKTMENSFTVSVSPQDNARYIGFAEHSSKNSGRYLIKLNVLKGNSEIPVISSQPFILPKLYDNEDIANLNKNPLIHISGVQNLKITKNTDRQSRTKRQ